MIIQDVRPEQDIFLTLGDLSKISKGIAELIWRFKFFGAEFKVMDQNQGIRQVGVGHWGKW